MARKYGSNDEQAGGVPVVVRDGESPLHGEGAQLDRLAGQIIWPQQGEDL